MKKVLLLSYNPVPTKTKKTVEGSGLRFWRMGLGLQKAGIKHIDIGVWHEFSQGGQTTNGMNIVSYDGSLHLLKELVGKYNTVVFSSALSELATIILNAIPKDTQIIIDAYSPVYVEFLTKSLDKTGDEELLTEDNYYPFVNAFNECLLRADYILIGNENQKHFYRGVLGGIGGLLHHDDKRFITLPAFVEATNNKFVKRDGLNKINVLWFGGVYPWFDIKDIVQAFADKEIADIAKLTIVGGSNPFYPKDNKRFNGKYLEALNLCKKLSLSEEVVEFKDWVDYEDRIAVFREADIAISVNSNFMENEYSFRLRVADLAGNGVPILTNGGDPLGDFLLGEGVAFKLDMLNKDTISQSIKSAVKNRKLVEQAKDKLRSRTINDKLHIYRYTKELATIINKGKTTKARDNTYSTIDKIINATNNGNVLSNNNIDAMDGVSTKQLTKIFLGRVKKVVKLRVSNMLKKTDK